MIRKAAQEEGRTRRLDPNAVDEAEESFDKAMKNLSNRLERDPRSRRRTPENVRRL